MTTGDQKQYRLTSGQRWAVFISIPIVLVLLFAAYIFLGLSYKVAKIRCGHEPIVGSDTKSNSYITPDNSMYEYYKEGPFSKYFCTEKQAQEAGFSESL